MPADLVLGLDASTTACKAIVWDKNGVALAEARRELALSMPASGWHEQDAESWWGASSAALAEVAAQIDPGRLAGLALAHQRETFVPVDAAGRPLRPAIVWMDERSRDLLPDLEREYGAERFHRLVGRPLSGNLAVGKIFWLQRHEPEICRAAHFYLDTHAFLVHRLTGRFVTGWGSADPTGLFDMAGKRWAEELLPTIGVSPAQLPELQAPGTVLGAVTREAAASCGLPAGLPVVCGLGDGQAAGLGAGITRAGTAYLNLGTAVVSGTHTDTYTIDRAFRTTMGGIAGAYLLETVLLGGTYTVKWFAERFGPHQEEALPARTAEDVMEEEIAALPPGAAGLLLVPYWNSAMNPYWDAGASGIVAGWRGIHDRRHFYRAILEGIAFEQRLATEGVEAATGVAVEGFVVMGGGSRSALWRQIVADITGKPVRRCKSPEASALGAGMLAAGATGLYPDTRSAAAAMASVEEATLLPDPGRHAFYTQIYDEVYRYLFPALRPYIDRLSTLSFEG